MKKSDKLSGLKPLVEFFNQNRERFCEEHHNEFVLIYENSERGFFETQVEAYLDAKNQDFTPGRFLIQRCLRPEEEQEAVFRSRVK